jgi:two-component system sensor histidine kinase PilS (NtrC family)
MFSIGRFLRWVYVSRVALAAAIFATALLVWTRPDVRPEATRLATLMLVAALAVTAVSSWYTEIARRSPGSNFLYLQALFDVALVTAVVHVTGRADSDLVPLYVLVITEAALLLPARGGLLVGWLATLLYLLDALFGGHVAAFLGGATGGTALDPSVLVQVGLFGLVAVATVLVGDRLRRAGSQLGEVESELRQLRLDTTDILGTLDTGVATLDSEGRLVYMNSSAESLLGLRSRDWLGRPALAEMDRIAPGIEAVVQHTLSEGEPVRRYETRSAQAGSAGELRVLGLRTTALEREEDPWVTVVMQDITDTKRVEELGRRTERLEAVRELSASLAHEIKNPLASIRSAVEQLTGSPARLEEQDRGVLGDLVLRESDRLSRLLSGFIEFSRVEVQERVRIDLYDVAQAAVAVVRQHPDATETRVEVEGSSAELVGDPDLLHRSVFNLVLNAVQHSPANAPVRVEVTPVSGVDLPSGIEVRNAALLRVSDRGPGIDAATAARMVDPFFTTRVGGSGLGLALVHRAVEAHEGVMFIDGEEGQGTTVTVYLPTLTAEGAS